tara:strand:- start:10 stop:618 length:609 start_codon:yes stop_codon:yes gene_type:complete
MFSRKVYIANISRMDWLKANSIQGWENILTKTDYCVKNAIKESNSNEVDLIGHSSGGILLRLYLSKEIFNGKSYGGSDFTSNLITLGSPHQALRATSLRKFVDKKFPGNFFKNVNYVSIGGELVLDSDDSSLLTKIFAKNSYKSISGEKNSIGDGLVPLSSSLLKGSQKIILKKTTHSRIFGENWYGKSERIEEWYREINWA